MNLGGDRGLGIGDRLNLRPLDLVVPGDMSSAAFLLVAAAVTLLLFGRANRRVEGNVRKSYLRLANWAPWLGVLIQPAHTPYERADLLSGAVPDGKEPLRNLTHQFVRQQFSRSRSTDEGFDSREEWQALRPAMIRRTLAYQLERLRSRRPKPDNKRPKPRKTGSPRSRSASPMKKNGWKKRLLTWKKTPWIFLVRRKTSGSVSGIIGIDSKP